MSKINVYSSSASNAIKVFDANSTGLKPDNAILVTTGTEPSNAIQINVGDKKWCSIAVNFGGQEPTPPSPTWETTKIGDQVWMAENLSYDDGGDGIYKFDNVTVNDVNFGTQYYYTPKAIKRISGDFNGWHISTKEDWDLLKNQVNNDCESLKSTSGWNDGKNGNNLNGFNGIPVGLSITGGSGDEYYEFVAQSGNFAIYGIINPNGVGNVALNKKNHFDVYSTLAGYGFNIRLVKDNE
jgi:uncharacterized protein (TIGR02145 family)